MGKIKVRKIGNSVGAIFPKEWGLEEGDILNYQKKDNHYIIDTQQLAQKHDRQMIEESFADFETGRVLSEEEMKQEFGKYGWGE
ncbi:AbrB family transcriptional regulator [Tetragenococcus halophilus]|uniref:AbrB family transcriptional regulator n=2 Tax=Tetragenococcus halophilus TaxID=51669 RepID=A0A2H6CKZ3_TETHA|nr:AbrB family transcriptional regulator [Tetragenococcus halophilus]AOF48620.1 AbrB family transcriptional regulator [Tetragenococcus halophilus]AYW50221.1 AbrB family transcriptional regulator [Tetragenococcus halophilus]MCF1602335.1 AbrB family transcriptional regulator [Tetragenococcus halophilus]MCF1676646.1 AbrB family transcriptional regulator [Tetragenococcus halophilus]MCO7026886.1 AbrB family transcriptional regulator [Tetragenococcus halophilus]